jgi:hypothetical protein
MDVVVIDVSPVGADTAMIIADVKLGVDAYS